MTVFDGPELPGLLASLATGPANFWAPARARAAASSIWGADPRGPNDWQVAVDLLPEWHRRPESVADVCFDPPSRGTVEPVLSLLE